MTEVQAATGYNRRRKGLSSHGEMNFIVAAAPLGTLETKKAQRNGTHVYRVERNQPQLLQSLPKALRSPESLQPHRCGLLACLQPNGSVSIWDTNWLDPVPCEVPPQAGPIARCYFSSRGHEETILKGTRKDPSWSPGST